MEQKDKEMESDGGAGSDGRIVLKIRVGRTAEAASPPPPVEEMKRHYCKVCDKSFGSGKAYGGHVSSAHVQANKDHSYRKLNSKMRKQHHGSGSGDYSCRHCGKVFWSKKSLFGHMRCHPERGWRGMEPPPKSKPDPDSSGDSGCNLKDWPAQAKRIRGGANPNFHAGSAEEEAFVAGRQLINMLAGKGNPRKTSSESESNSDSDGKARVLPPNLGILPLDIDINDERVLGAVIVLAEGIRNRNRVLGKRMSPNEEDDGEYICSKRRFATHQGGHGSWIDRAAGEGEKVAVFDLNVTPDEEEEEIGWKLI